MTRMNSTARMDEAQNRSSMSESRERLQQARENVRRSSEALQEGQVPRAISAGSRAEQELDELRDEFRERTSDRFAEEARDLQQRANKLVEAQKEISELLNDGPTPASEKPRSMRESSPREKLLEGLNQQGERLQDLMERMKQTVEEAEESQPLLAQETIRFLSPRIPRSLAGATRRDKQLFATWFRDGCTSTRGVSSRRPDSAAG